MERPVDIDTWDKSIEAIDTNSFWVLAVPDGDDDDTANRVREFVRCVAIKIKSMSGAYDHTFMGEPVSESGRVESFLFGLFSRIIPKCDSLTCVVELDHLDDVYRDLYAENYSREFFDSSRSTIRISLFNAKLDEDQYFLRPGRLEEWEKDDIKPRRNENDEEYPPLNADFIGSIVLIPRESGTVGRTLLDPKWLIKDSAEIRLSDFDITVRGKRLSVPSFPYRQQDDEVLSCAELSILNMVCYYSNEYNDYAITMPGEVIAEVARGASERVTPSKGLNYSEVGRVLRKVGFYPRRYDKSVLLPDVGMCFKDDTDTRLRRILRAYIDSGIPVAANIQPDSHDPGHSLVVIGLGAPLSHAPQSIPYGMRAERIVAELPSGSHKSLALVDAADFEEDRAFVVIDDAQMPFAEKRWPYLSVYEGMRVVELMVPLTRAMALDAMDARDRAGEILRSERHGFAVLSGDEVADGEQFVLTQQMVSVRSYLRYRVATCDPDVAFIYETAVLPRFLWLFEIIRLRDWGKPRGERKAVGELLLDATSVSANPNQLIVLIRYPELIYYHAPDGESWKRVSPECPYEFPAYTRNLRHCRGVRYFRPEQ